MKTPLPIVPALIPESEAAVKEAAAQLSFAREFHLDVVDGQFVPLAAWPYQPAGEPRAVAEVLRPFTLEVDLMVAAPLPAATAWLEAGADMLVFHAETIERDAFAEFASTAPASIGVSIHGATPLSTLEAYLEYADYVQLMGIYEIGSQGQPFSEGVLEQIETLQRRYPNVSITVDGSVNADTITTERRGR